MYSFADKTRVIRTYSLIMLVWWLAVIAPSGETIFMEWRDEGTCRFYERLFLRIQGLKVTTCSPKTTQQEVS